jgi:predicted MPP superfamily phosphohydrolase
MVLLIYGGANYYIFRRVVHTAHLSGAAATALKIGLLVCILAYPLSRFTFAIKPISLPLTWVGGFWLAALSWAVIGFAAVDLVRLTDLAFGWFPNWLTADRIRIGQRMLAGGAVVMALLLISGRIIAANPIVRNFDLTIDRLPKEKDGYRVVLFSDTHLGQLKGVSFLNRLVEKVNSLQADLILIPGDVFDENPKHTPWAREPLSRLKARDGVIASTGNHEFYSGLNECVAMLREAGIAVLRDETLTIPGTTVVCGLDDITGSRQYGRPPKPIAEIVQDVDPALPLLLLHHTPVRREEASESGVDLMVSGHTHGGQQWPFGYMADLTYGVRKGLTRIGGMNFFLTVGVGTWGPPIRLGAAPEIVVITLRPSGR